MARVLVLTTGSNSVKWTVLAADKTVLADGSEPWAAEDSAAPERITSGSAQAASPFLIIQ